MRPIRQVSTSAFHLLEDGLVDQERFLRLLVDAFRVASRGRKRVDLRQLQAELLHRGWHP
jgi:hypothetical protein